MPTMTYTPLATVTLGSSASSVTFSSIPATYRDLILVVGNLTGSATNSLYLRLNGDTGSNYSFVYMNAVSGGTVSSSGTNNLGLFLGSANAGISSTERQTSIANIMDYSATDKHKTALARWNQTAEVAAIASRWASTSAITSLQVYINGGATMGTGTTASLYGVIA